MTPPLDTFTQPQAGGVAIWTYYEDKEPNYILETFAARGGLFLVGGETQQSKNHYAYQLALDTSKFSSGISDVSKAEEKVYAARFETNLTGNFFMPYENDPAKSVEENAASYEAAVKVAVDSIMAKNCRIIVIEGVKNKFMADVALALANHALCVFATIDSGDKESLVASFNAYLVENLDAYEALAMPILAAYYNVIDTPETGIVFGAYHGYGFLTVPVS